MRGRSRDMAVRPQKVAVTREQADEADERERRDRERRVRQHAARVARELLVIEGDDVGQLYLF